MDVRHERPAPETMFEMTAPLIVGFPNGETVKISRWSLRGLYEPALAGRDLSEIVLSVPFHGVGVYFKVDLVPGEEPDEFLFKDLSGRERETLALFYRNLLTGKMASTEDMITALDTPVDLVPMGETEAEKSAGGKGGAVRRRFRIAGNVVFYIAVAALVFGYLGHAAWVRLTRIEVTMAWVSAPYVTVAAPAPGQVAEILAEPGDLVDEGTAILRIDDPRLDLAIVAAESALARAEADLAAAQPQDSAVSTETDTVPAQDDGETAADGVPEETGGSPVDDTATAALQATRDARAEDLAALRDRQETLTVTAPGRGTIINWIVAEGDPLSTTMPILQFELDEPRSVIAYLTLDHALDVWAGMSARVYFVIDGRRVVTEGLVRSVSVDEDRGEIRTTVTLDRMTAEQTRALFENDTPVRVDFQRDSFRLFLRDARTMIGLGG